MDRSQETGRSLIRLEGELALHLGQINFAIAAFETALEMTQRVGLPASKIEARLALARAVADDVERATEICDRLDHTMQPPHVELAEAYLQTGNKKKAREHGLLGYASAWCEGPPYSRHWELTCCQKV